MEKHCGDKNDYFKKSKKDRRSWRRSGSSERTILDPMDRAEGRGPTVANLRARLLHREELWVEQRDVDGAKWRPHGSRPGGSACPLRLRHCHGGKPPEKNRCS